MIKNKKLHIMYYAFDWDDNILYMPTVIHMQKMYKNNWIDIDVSTSEYSIVRLDKENWRVFDNNPDKAYSEFRDFGPRGEYAFLEDTIKAIENKKFGPSWSDFKECLINGSLFAIITARGHEKNTIRKTIEWIIDNVLVDSEKITMYNNLLKYIYLFKIDVEYDRILNLNIKLSTNNLVKIYLDNCDFVGISAPSMGGNPEFPEKVKEEVLLNFSKKINIFAKSIGYDASIGFSDDDTKNIKHIKELIDSLKSEEFQNLYKYVIKLTKDSDNIIKSVKIFNESSTPGLESSILSFTQFNNMTNKLYPSDEKTRQDDYTNQIRRQTEYLAKLSKDLLPSKKKKKKIIKIKNK